MERAPEFVDDQRRERVALDILGNEEFAIPTGPAGLAIAKILRVPNILTLHGGELFRQPLELTGYKNPLLNAVVRCIINRATRVHANSHDTANAARQFLGITRDIHIISTGFSRPAAFPEPPPRVPAPEARVRLVMVSRLVERKGLTYLLEALQDIHPERWLLTLVGDGPEETPLKALAERLGIAENLRFVGFVSEAEKFEHLAAADLFVLPTLHEGLGLVYFEAMYAGLPIITTNNGGQTDFLTPEENALLVPIKDGEALRAAIERGIADTAWRERCGRKNRKKVLELDIRNLVGQYDVILRHSEGSHDLPGDSPLPRGMTTDR
jgi:glycosyltransferase involved in cell wall biosynthesis